MTALLLKRASCRCDDLRQRPLHFTLFAAGGCPAQRRPFALRLNC